MTATAMPSTALERMTEVASSLSIEQIVNLPDVPLTSIQATLLAAHPDSQKLALMLAHSGMVPKAYVGQPGAVSVALNVSYRLAMDPLFVMQNLAVINGNPRIFGDLVPALIMRSPYWVKTNEYVENEDLFDKLLQEPDWHDAAKLRGKGYDLASIAYVCEMTRRLPDGSDKVYKTRYTVADAVRGQLWNKRGQNNYVTPWVTEPKRMMTWRPRHRTARDAFPDALMGFVPLLEGDEAGVLANGSKTAEAKVIPLSLRLRSRAAGLAAPAAIPTQDVVDVALAANAVPVQDVVETPAAEGGAPAQALDLLPRPEADARETHVDAAVASTGDDTPANEDDTSFGEPVLTALDYLKLLVEQKKARKRDLLAIARELFGETMMLPDLDPEQAVKVLNAFKAAHPDDAGDGG